jgi:hypothetical protein
MKTTALVIEYLMAGVLMLLALGVWVVLFFPDWVGRALEFFDESVSAGILLSTVFVAVAYGFGIFTEVFGLNLFEGKHDEIKKEWMKK